MSDLPFGPGRTSAYEELILTAASGTLYLPLYQGEAAARRQQRPDLQGQWSSGQGNQKDVARRVRALARGAGFSRKPSGYTDAAEWDGFAEAENACCRFGYALPSGEQTAVSVTAAWGECKKIISFNDDLIFIFANRIAYRSGGTGALTSLLAATGTDTFTDAEVWNNSLRVATVCAHANPNQHFFVTLTPGGGPYTIINPTPAAPAGTAATAATPQCSLLQTVFWEYQGVAAFRLAAKTGHAAFQYMITPTGDPYDALNWGAATTVGEVNWPLVQLVSSHDTLWAIKPEGVYSITDANASAGGENMTPYYKQEIPPDDTAGVSYYFHDRLIVARTLGLEAIDVNSWQVQDRPHPIDISFGRPNDSALNGEYTSLTSDNGWLVGAMLGLDGKARVLYGTPRARESVTAGVTEYDWFPEIGPFATKRITAMVVNTPLSTLRPTLWLGLKDTGTGNPSLVAVDLFKGASPLGDTAHRYQTTCSITFTDEDWGSRISAKGALVGAVSCRNTDTVSGRKVDVEVVAESFNPFTGTPSMSVINTGAAGGTAALHSVISRAQVVRSKATLTSTATVPVVLDEWEMRAHLGYPLRRRGTWLVELSTAAMGDLPDYTKSTADETLLVVLAQGLELVTATLPDGETMICVLDNVVPFRDESRNTSGRRVRVMEVAWTQVS